jgi:hypothetical protein
MITKERIYLDLVGLFLASKILLWNGMLEKNTVIITAALSLHDQTGPVIWL